MTEDQLHALKCFIEAKVQHGMSPSFANERYLKIEEERLDREMIHQPAANLPTERANGDATAGNGSPAPPEPYWLPFKVVGPYIQDARGNYVAEISSPFGDHTRDEMAKFLADVVNAAQAAPPSPHVEYSASRGQSKVTYWVSREEGDRIRAAAVTSQFEGASCGDAQGLPVGPKAGSRPAAPSSTVTSQAKT